MSDTPRPLCPECAAPDAVDRRAFLRGAAAGAALLTVPATARLRADTPATPVKPSEDLVKELYSTLTAEQKALVVRPWNHGAEQGRTATRLRMYNAPIGKRIGEVYTQKQQELVERILRSIAADDSGYRCLTRDGTFDASQSLQGCGADIFGDPGNGQYAWVFSGHHLTVRCDGDSEEGAAFGGPLYYGHSPDGYSPRNVFFYQTKAVLNVFDVLSEAQRKVAVVTGSPGELEPSIRFRAARDPKPGLSYGEMNRAQQQLVESTMRSQLSPYRRQDADEVMTILKTNGGLEKMHLAFYQERAMNDNQRWHFWRLEGPGFVWNFRVLPHVHTYVNISTKIPT